MPFRSRINWVNGRAPTEDLSGGLIPGGTEYIQIACSSGGRCFIYKVDDADFEFEYEGDKYMLCSMSARLCGSPSSAEKTEDQLQDIATLVDEALADFILDNDSQAGASASSESKEAVDEDEGEGSESSGTKINAGLLRGILESPPQYDSSLQGTRAVAQAFTDYRCSILYVVVPFYTW
jgi:hypothetical protein